MPHFASSISVLILPSSV